MDLWIMEMKQYNTFAKAPNFELQYLIVSCYILDTHFGMGSQNFEEMLLVYSTTNANWVAESFVENFQRQ